MAITPGSPAIDAGTSAGAPPTDQRGYARVGAVDIGAYEFQGDAIFGNGFDRRAWSCPVGAASAAIFFRTTDRG